MTFDNNKSKFENNIFDELYDIVKSLKVKKVREYKGWSDFFKCYFYGMQKGSILYAISTVVVFWSFD